MKSRHPMAHRWARAVAVCVLAGLVAGCFGRDDSGPSNPEVLSALRQLVASDHRAPVNPHPAGVRGAPSASVTVTHFHNLGCNPAPDYKGYVCGTVFDLVSPGHAERQLTRLIRVVHTRAGWKATMQ